MQQIANPLLKWNFFIECNVFKIDVREHVKHTQNCRNRQKQKEMSHKFIN